MLKILGQTILTALLSTICLTLALTLLSYTAPSNRLDHTYYFGFFELFIIYGMFIVSFYFIVGIPVALIIHYTIKKKLLQAIAYFIAGIVCGFLMFLSFKPFAEHASHYRFQEGLSFGILTLAAAILFYIVQLAITYIFNRGKVQKIS